MKVTKMEECMDYGGDWVIPVYSHENTIQSLVELLIFTTSEGWMTYMFSVVD